MIFNCDVCNKDSENGIIKNGFFKCNDCKDDRMILNLFCNVCDKESEDGTLKDGHFKCDACIEEEDKEKVYCPECKERVCGRYESELEGSIVFGECIYKNTIKCNICNSTIYG